MIKTELKFWSCTGCTSIPSLPLARQVRLCKVHGSVLHLQDGSDGNCYYNFTFKCMCIYTGVHAQITSVCNICYYSLAAKLVSSPELLLVSFTLEVPDTNVASDNTQTEHARESGPCGKSPVFVLNTRCHCFFKMS